MEEEIHSSAKTDRRSLVKLFTLTAPAHLISAVVSSCCSHTAGQVLFLTFWMTGVGRSSIVKLESAFKTEIQLKLKHSPETIFTSTSHIIRNYCATLIMIININYVQSLLSGQTVLMLPYIWISKAFWESKINSTFPMPLNVLKTWYVTMKMSWNLKDIAQLLWQLSSLYHGHSMAASTKKLGGKKRSPSCFLLVWGKWNFS